MSYYYNYCVTIYLPVEQRPHELRVEITSDGKDYVALYKTFKLENEADNYRIRLGTATSSIDDGTGNSGLSFHNNAGFSTFDRDNDKCHSHCAVTLKCGWWFKCCHCSKLNAQWKDGRAQDAWYNGTKWMSATRTEMKIRPL
ncbi:angiopoietin-related protein 7 [Elysia marginata]|uniref:Angiopoietin-related protein 7 n=1 Tax=Elysia marginata TaxID=1093978 RepID=A0AAV4IUA5_9GAST|nr:angiopoietin-related protein 7 [Elysia marginata]